MKEHCDNCGRKVEVRHNETQVRCVRAGHFIRRRKRAEASGTPRGLTLAMVYPALIGALPITDQRSLISRKGTI